MELLHHTSHTGLCDAAPTKDIDRIIGDIVRTPRGVALQQPDRPAEQFALLGVIHLAHLERDALQPILARLGQRDHLGQFLAHHGLADQRLPKHDALVRPLQAFLDDGAHPPDHAARHGPALVVEVAHNHDEPVMFLAQEVVHGNLDVVELDERRRRRGRVRRLDPLGLYVVVSRHEDDREALFRLAPGHEIVCEHAVCDPFFRSCLPAVRSHRQPGGPKSKSMLTDPGYLSNSTTARRHDSNVEVVTIVMA